MGREKALLPYGGMPLVLNVARIVQEAAGSVILAGRVAAFAGLGLPMIEDQHAGLGPLGGIHAVLAATSAEWNLVVACDMPLLDAGFLRALLETAEAGQADAVMARGATGVAEPLCAVYRRTCRETVETALHAGRLKITAALEPLTVRLLDVPRPEWLANANTPGDWERIGKGEAPVD